MRTIGMMKRKGLGYELLEEFSKLIKESLINPKTHSYYSKPVRSGVLKRFPYSVSYEIINNKIFIYSVFMFRQRPSKRRLKK